MAINKNINDDITLAYLLKKTEAKAVSTAEAIIEGLSSAVETLQNAVETLQNLLGGHSVGKDVPANAVFTDTHRPIKVNGTQNLGNNTTALNLKNGSNVSITANGGDVTIAATDTVTTVSTTGSGNAITALSASNGALTATKGATFLTSHQDISGKVNKSGDTITGGLTVENFVAVKRGSGNGVAIDDQSMDSTTNPSSAKNGIALAFRDKNGVAYAALRARHTAGGHKGLYIYGNNSSAPSGSQINALYLMVDNDGNYLVSVTNAAAWRAALGLESPIGFASFATAGANFTITSQRGMQWGKVVQVDVAVKCTTAVTVTTGTIVFTIASAFRPCLDINCPDSVNNRTLWRTNGNVQSFKTIAKDATLSFRACYIIA